MLDKLFYYCVLHVIERRVFSFSYAAAGNTVMSYGRLITAGNIAIAELTFRAQQYLHIGGLEAAFAGMGMAQPTCTSQAGCHTIIRVSHGIRSFINKLIQKQDASSIIPFL